MQSTADDEPPPPLAFVRVRRRGRLRRQPASNDEPVHRHPSSIPRADPRDLRDGSRTAQPVPPRGSGRATLAGQPRGRLLDSSSARASPSTCEARGKSIDYSLGGSFAPLISHSTPSLGAHGPLPTSVENHSKASVPVESARSIPSSSAQTAPFSSDHSSTMPTVTTSTTEMKDAAGNGAGGGTEAFHPPPPPPPPKPPSSTPNPLEEALLERFHATLDDSLMLEPVVAFDEDELISSMLNRKNRTKTKPDHKPKAKIKLDSKTMKKTPKGKGRPKIDEELGDGLLSALLDNDVTPEELELCYGPRGGRNKH